MRQDERQKKGRDLPILRGSFQHLLSISCNIDDGNWTVKRTSEHFRKLDSSSLVSEMCPAAERVDGSALFTLPKGDDIYTAGILSAGRASLRGLACLPV